jgi:hypothetical protein
MSRANSAAGRAGSPVRFAPQARHFAMVRAGERDIYGAN